MTNILGDLEKQANGEPDNQGDDILICTILIVILLTYFTKII